MFPLDPLVLLFLGCGVSCCGTALFNFLSQSCFGTEVCFQACPCSCSCSTGGCRASGPAAEVLFLFLVKGGGFRSDEDLARHLSKLSFGFVAKLIPTGCKLAQGIPSKIEKKGGILILSPDMYSFIFFLLLLFWQAVLIYTHAITQNLASSTGIGPDTLSRLWLAGSPK